MNNVNKKIQINEFGRVMDRLKIALNVTNDKVIAKLLGLSTTAYAERKKHNSIPMDKIRLICATRSINLNDILENGAPPSSGEHIKPSREAVMIAESVARFGVDKLSVDEIERYNQMVDALSEIFTSKDAESITTMEWNLSKLRDDLRGRRADIEKDRRIADLEARLARYEAQQGHSPLSTRRRKKA